VRSSTSWSWLRAAVTIAVAKLHDHWDDDVGPERGDQREHIGLVAGQGPGAGMGW
jgi:hypothetical protein